MIDPRGRRVRCPTCAAAPGHRCTDGGRPVVWHHPARTIAGHANIGRGTGRDVFTDDQRDLLRRLTAAGPDRIRPDDIAAALDVDRATVYRAIRSDDHP